MNWNIGDVLVKSVIELDISVDPDFSLPDATAKNLSSDFDWLKPYFVDQDGRLKFRVQALLIESYGQKIIIDTCIGNDKKRAEPAFNELNGFFLEDITKAGFSRHDVNIVVCTHLHYDHVGWNTMKVHGEWIPTFPNARYLMAESEVKYCKEQEDDFWVKTFGDSVAPVFKAGLVDLVDCNYQITPEIRLFHTPGHTPGHCSVAITSQGKNAVITGDVMHHPCQCAHPDWLCTADTSPEQAEATRRAFLEKVSEQNILVIGTHWSAPKPVKISKHNMAWKVDIA
ncbi:beta-lactamase [[Leptolyngbya] sp. PCC 7376]|uniref:MBL fold metallo-hydrolase n=1 Tax=[Leptolyngbya] sp. PCC 7376 TaxID=111781 RepID=UPI00029F4C00|nr:MBL fold metallo-hydrolase [[Leptolyngbya] sp. PCC 7376]AFY40090.1 beta-lactamase [[Leptolyngbya] sp. PCC 7376]